VIQYQIRKRADERGKHNMTLSKPIGTKLLNQNLIGF